MAACVGVAELHCSCVAVYVVRLALLSLPLGLEPDKSQP